MLSIKTTGCGIKKSEFPLEDPGDIETSSKNYFIPLRLLYHTIAYRDMCIKVYISIFMDM